MGILAIKKLELCEPIEGLYNLQEYEGVRFYCTLYGEMLGFFTVWNKGRSIGREQLLHEISLSMWKPLAYHLFGDNPNHPTHTWAEIHRMLASNFKVGN